MNTNSSLDWRGIVAAGFVVSCVISVSKMDKDAIERVALRAIDSLKELAIAMTSNR